MYAPLSLPREITFKFSQFSCPYFPRAPLTSVSLLQNLKAQEPFNKLIKKTQLKSFLRYLGKDENKKKNFLIDLGGKETISGSKKKASEKISLWSSLKLCHKKLQQ